eukprot:752162-Hanusia_phi.AAC.2
MSMKKSKKKSNNRPPPPQTPPPPPPPLPPHPPFPPPPPLPASSPPPPLSAPEPAPAPQVTKKIQKSRPPRPRPAPAPPPPTSAPTTPSSVSPPPSSPHAPLPPSCSPGRLRTRSAPPQLSSSTRLTSLTGLPGGHRRDGLLGCRPALSQLCSSSAGDFSLMHSLDAERLLLDSLHLPPPCLLLKLRAVLEQLLDLQVAPEEGGGMGETE